MVHQRLTTNSKEWHRMKTTGTMGDKKWQRKATSDNMTMSDSKWHQVVQRMKTTQYTLIRMDDCHKTQKYTLLQGTDVCN